MSVDTAILLDETADPAECAGMLEEIGFAEPTVALERLRALARDDVRRQALAEALPMLLAALGDNASPDTSLVNFERFLQSVPEPVSQLRHLAENPRAVEILVRLFVGSQFLTEILIRHPGYLRDLTVHKRIAEFKSREDFCREAMAAIGEADGDIAGFNGLRRYQRWELLRIGACDAFGLMDLRSVTVQLSLLADSVVQAALTTLAADLGVELDGFAVVAMGKLGGEELNYSSDIDLVFVARENARDYWQLGQKLIVVLTESSPEGFLYRVDMRLRPWGRSGALVNSIDAHVDYVRKQGRLWEKQALLKARPIAGDLSAGADFVARLAPIIFTSHPDEVREDVLKMKQSIEEKLVSQGREWGDAKSGIGSIRDIEFVAQYLQLINGGLVADIRSFNTLDALVRLADLGYLHADEYRVLTDAYGFLRTIEHSLQLMHYRQEHALPTSRRELAWFARRMDFTEPQQLLDHFNRHTRSVRRVFEKYLMHGDSAVEVAAPTADPLQAHRRKMGPTYTELFSADEIDRHARMLDELTEAAPVMVETVAVEGEAWRLTIVGRDHPGCLSVMCGLMLVWGIDITDGDVFTGIRTEATPGRARRFVNVFTVTCAGEQGQSQTFAEYHRELSAMMADLHGGDAEDVQGRLVKRVSDTLLQVSEADIPQLFDVEIRIDNEGSEEFTALHIESADTIGFLYELSNALTLCDVQIERVILTSRDGRVADTLLVSDREGTRLTDEHRLQELRAAVVLIKHFTHLLPRSPNPQRALTQFRDFLENLFNRPGWVEELSSLERSDVLDALARLLGVSSFLWKDFLRLQHENLFPVLTDVERLATQRVRSDLAAELAEELQGVDDKQARRKVLNAFKDREMFRVDMRHILGHIHEFGQFSAELTDIAEVVVAAGTRICENELASRYGRPRGSDGQPCRLCVVALGKCGGRELGFASDIELMFVYEGGGSTDGDQVISNSEFFEKLVERFTHAIAAREDGIFQVDLRLRPYGRAGTLSVSMDAFEDYFGPDGAAWPYERQALVKLRAVAGDADFGEHVTELRDRLIYRDQPFDVSSMRAMREKQLRQLVRAGTINSKLSPGGLVDCEYLVQALQMTHGHGDDSLRNTNTREAMAALREAGHLSADAYQQLSAAHMFLRRLIDALRVVRGNAKDLTVPDPDTQEFEYLARRLRYGRAAESLAADLRQHMGNVIGLLPLLDGPGVSPS